MKALKSVGLLAVISLFSLTARAQGGGYDFINVGVGVSGWGIPIYAGVDFTVADRVTVGGMLSAQRKVERFGSLLGVTNNRWIHTIIGLSANGNYHFFEPGDQFDVYAGANLGYYFWNVRSTEAGVGSYSGSGSGGFGLGLQLGGRYRLDNGITLHGEVGGGTVFSAARVGVSFPF